MSKTYASISECPYLIDDKVKVTYLEDVSYSRVTKKKGAVFIGWVSERYADGVMVENDTGGFLVAFDQVEIEKSPMVTHSEAQKIGCLIAILPGYRLLGGKDILKQGDLWFNFVEMKFEPVYDQFFGLLCENYIAIRTLTVIEEKELPSLLTEEETAIK